MNKHIHELVMKSTNVQFKYNPWTGELENRAETFDKEKFTELLLQECLDVMESMKDCYDDRAMFNFITAIEMVKSRVSEHFEIKGNKNADSV